MWDFKGPSIDYLRNDAAKLHRLCLTWQRRSSTEYSIGK
jgi:hypothetical protein